MKKGYLKAVSLIDDEQLDGATQLCRSYDRAQSSSASDGDLVQLEVYMHELAEHARLIPKVTSVATISALIAVICLLVLNCSSSADPLRSTLSIKEFIALGILGVSALCCVVSVCYVLFGARLLSNVDRTAHFLDQVAIFYSVIADGYGKLHLTDPKQVEVSSYLRSVPGLVEMKRELREKLIFLKPGAAFYRAYGSDGFDLRSAVEPTLWNPSSKDRFIRLNEAGEELGLIERGGWRKIIFPETAGKS